MIRWRCTLCGQCCKTYIPLVLPRDVTRIQESQDLPLSSFIVFYKTTDFSEPLDESYQRLLFQTKHGPLAMCLSRVDIADGEAGCVFVKNNLCSIHTVRPLICRQYPFLPQDPNHVDGPFKLKDEPCFGRHATDEIVDEAPVRQNFRIFHEQQDTYLRKIKEWNDDPVSGTRDIEEFLSFVGLRWS